MLRVVTSAHKGFAPSGKKIHLFIAFEKIICIFEFFLELTQVCVLLMQGTHIMYKTLGFRRLLEAFCPASAFVSADRDEARNPQRFIHVSVMGKAKQPTVQKNIYK